MKTLYTLDDYVEINQSIFRKNDLLDLLRLQKELLIKENIYATIEECEVLWQTYSSSVQASYLFFPDEDEDILKLIKIANGFTSFEDWLTDN